MDDFKGRCIMRMEEMGSEEGSWKAKMDKTMQLSGRI
jgi:hypothetical protein